MATIVLEIPLKIGAEQAWALVSDYGAPHRLAPGFVADCRLEGEDRIVTFANGPTVRERLVTLDRQGRRLVYTSVGGRAEHHNAVIEVLDQASGSVIRWTTDVLPHTLGPTIYSMMERGAAAIGSERPDASGVASAMSAA